jgi:hypothetical protein
MVQISRLTPAQGVPVGGTSVLIEGSGFAGVTAVYFGSTPALSLTPGSDSSLTAISPPATVGPVRVMVVTAAGTSPSSSPKRSSSSLPLKGS